MTGTADRSNNYFRNHAKIGIMVDWRPCRRHSCREAAIKKFTTRIRVYWADCDSAGILYYGNFFRYFEIAEEELYFSLGRPRVDIFNGLQVGFPRVETWCKFFKPARHGDLMVVTVWIGRRTEKTLLFQFELRRDGDTELAAEGGYTVVCVDRKRFQSIPLHSQVLEILQDYLPPATASTGKASGKRGSGGKGSP